jgi:hypothetical protein
MGKKDAQRPYPSLAMVTRAIKECRRLKVCEFKYAQLDENSGSVGWTMTPSGMRGVLNDAVSIYFADATLASAFVARWCAGSKVETTEGVFRVREDEPAPRVGAGLHRTP